MFLVGLEKIVLVQDHHGARCLTQLLHSLDQLFLFEIDVQNDGHKVHGNAVVDC